MFARIVTLATRQFQQVARCVPVSRTACLATALLCSHGVLEAQQRRAPTTPRTATPPSTPASRAAAAALARAADAVVTIVAYRDGSSDVTTIAGARLADGRVVTSLRALRGASRAEVYGAEGDLLATVTTLDHAEVKLDLAVLPVTSGPGERLILARRSAVLTQKVSLLGPRKGATRSIADRTVTQVEPDDNGRPLLRLGSPITGPALGSPVVNARGELVAIALGAIPGRDDSDIAVDVSALRELLTKPTARLAFPARDGTVGAARPTGDPKAPGTVAAPRAPVDSALRARLNVFPERYGPPIAADTARTWAVELYFCSRSESRKKVYCYLRVTNLSQSATIQLNGGDLADSTRNKVAAAENLLTGESIQKVAGWRTKAELALRELESARIALEFSPPKRDTDAVRLMLDISGERTLWFGPFVLQRNP